MNDAGDGGSSAGDGSNLERLRAWGPWIAFAIACGPLLLIGFPKGHDWTFELVRVAEYRSAVAAGQLPPFWGENLYGGYGSPVFLFYAPLFAATAAVLSTLEGSIAGGATWALVGFSALGVVGIERLLRAACAFGGADRAPGLNRAAARVGTYLFVLSPYLLGDKLLRNACAEFVGLSLAPFALEGLLRARTRPGLAFGLVSAGVGLVIVAHNLTALALFASVLAGGLVLYPPWKERGPWLPLGAGLLAALALTAFFWVPALELTSLVRPEELLRGKFDFHRQFPALGELLGYGRFFSAGALASLTLLAAAVSGVRGPNTTAGEQRLLWGSLAASLLLIALCLRPTTPVWERVPMLPLLQFPWRLLGPLTLFVSLAGALAFARSLTPSSMRVQRIAEAAVLLLAIANAAPTLGMVRALPRDVSAQLPAFLEPASIRAGRQSVTVLDEYLPRSADPTLWKRERPTRGPVVATVPRAEVTVERDEGSHIELRVRSRAPTRVRLARWAFPGWELELDGRPGALESSASGALELRVPAGDTQVRLELRAPSRRRDMLVVSGVALVGWLCVVGYLALARGR